MLQKHKYIKKKLIILNKGVLVESLETDTLKWSTIKSGNKFQNKIYFY